MYFNHRVSQAAACLAYFLLLSLFPILLCVSSVLGLMDIDIGGLILQLQPVLPEAALDVLAGYLRYSARHQSPAFFVAGLVACWFSSSAAFRTITQVISDMYRDADQSLLRYLVASVLFPFALLVTVDLSLIVVVTGRRTLYALAQRLPFLDLDSQLWNRGRYVLLFAVFLLFVLGVLNLAAPKGTPRRPMVISGLAASLALVVASGVFSWFIGLSSRYSLVYGSLVSLIILLVWLYLCGQILFLCVVFTSVWYRRKNE